MTVVVERPNDASQVGKPDAPHKSSGFACGVLTIRGTKAGHVQNEPLNAEAKYLLERLHAVAEARAIATPTLCSLWVLLPVRIRHNPLMPATSTGGTLSGL